MRERKVPSDGIGIPLVLLCKQACNGYVCWAVGDNHGGFYRWELQAEKYLHSRG